MKNGECQWFDNLALALCSDKSFETTVGPKIRKYFVTEIIGYEA